MSRGLGHAMLDQDVAAVVCSELSRARETAMIAADILDLDVEVRQGLHEYRPGDAPTPSKPSAGPCWID